MLFKGERLIMIMITLDINQDMENDNDDDIKRSEGSQKAS